MTLYNQVYKVEFILAANSLAFLNCNSGSTMLPIFKAKIYPTNESTTCIGQIIGYELPTLTLQYIVGFAIHGGKPGSSEIFDVSRDFGLTSPPRAEALVSNAHNCNPSFLINYRSIDVSIMLSLAVGTIYKSYAQ
ncbi:hypothetical protein [Nostoc sp.]|uniref:hypothetical protein n=1 Tax=Nostoc sp. TaxID=1180 RepID=UPI002FFA244E